MEENIGGVKLNYMYYSGEDLYSDGKIEDELLDIVQRYEEKDFNAVINEKKDWAILYHLSHIRQNIVSFLPINKNDKVLEIGAGCGAITGKLADKAEAVTCIELSKKRSLINAYRNKNRDNIEIMVGNFQDIEKGLTEIYECITLIGVYEYAEHYIKSAKNPYIEFLKIIKSHLSVNGKVVLAIENKYGLKYYAGCREDHVNMFFEGIEGYQSSYGAKTFSKNVISSYAEAAGFENIQFYYPHPDYKLPMIIYSDSYLPVEGELGRYGNYNFDQDRIILFDENNAFNSCIRDGMFQQFANSFLMILS